MIFGSPRYGFCVFGKIWAELLLSNRLGNRTYPCSLSLTHFGACWKLELWDLKSGFSGVWRSVKLTLTTGGLSLKFDVFVMLRVDSAGSVSGSLSERESCCTRGASIFGDGFFITRFFFTDRSFIGVIIDFACLFNACGCSGSCFKSGVW